ncbi:excinuclease ABC subunit A [Bosea caraganae]|uniref:Excinuclease ABC subunit A n=2 Tax=Bosea caraganae TaxID=2763117 RepID=A0A370L843_9HYPH|nr:excinuclease ABC subunit A [Bosea caraganae]RDJ25228.1 excinuclease ABC subunit A [Bosea caraganae]RDJ26338.1 excinuclease ABC subunit A [Bosea caraganae]
MARNDRSLQSLDDAMRTPEATALRSDVKVYFGNQRHPRVSQTIGEWSSQRRGSAGRTDPETSSGCHYAFAEALGQLIKRAANEGGDAVINIVSVHGDAPLKSTAQYLCGIGNVKTAVRLTGTVVKFGR